jgi:three-Cys-motif partner protein
MLRGYLEAWFPIILQGGFRGLTYFEGFAGPGEYSGGESGSPIIALNALLEQRQILGTAQMARFVFIELDSRRKEHLDSVLNAMKQRVPGNVEVYTELGSFDQLMEPMIDRARAWHIPLFANLDEWGADVPYTHLERLAGIPRSEVMVTFLSDFFRRAARMQDLDKADRQFGSRDWRRVADLPSGPEKLRFLVAEYKRTLRRAGFQQTLAFEMVDEGGHGFYLVFGTKHRLGLERMKTAMWQIDRVYGVRFRDPKDVSQTALELDRPDLTPLRDDLLERLSDMKRHQVKELRDYALFETVYRPEHAMEVLLGLKREGRLGHDPQKGKIRIDGRVWLR